MKGVPHRLTWYVNVWGSTYLKSAQISSYPCVVKDPQCQGRKQERYPCYWTSAICPVSFLDMVQEEGFHPAKNVCAAKSRTIVFVSTDDRFHKWYRLSFLYRLRADERFSKKYNLLIVGCEWRWFSILSSECSSSYEDDKVHLPAHRVCKVLLAQ